MEIVPVTPAARTTKVRAAKAAESKSSSKTAKKSPAVKAEPAAAPPRKRKISLKKTTEPIAVPPADLAPIIATAAYFLAEQRCFAPGYELQDWLAAEHMIRSSPAFK